MNLMKKLFLLILSFFLLFPTLSYGESVFSRTAKKLDDVPISSSRLLNNTTKNIDNVISAEQRALRNQLGGIDNTKHFSSEKQAFVDMAQKDKKIGITANDMKAYKELNKELPDPFPSNKVRGPEIHSDRNCSEIHGHVGPVNHIPIKKK